MEENQNGFTARLISEFDKKPKSIQQNGSTPSSGRRRAWWESGRRKRHSCITIKRPYTRNNNLININTRYQPAFILLNSVQPYRCLSFLQHRGNKPLSHFPVSHMLSRRSSPVTARWQRKYSRPHEMTHCSPQDGGYRDTLSLLVIIWGIWMDNNVIGVSPQWWEKFWGSLRE